MRDKSNYLSRRPETTISVHVEHVALWRFDGHPSTGSGCSDQLQDAPISYRMLRSATGSSDQLTEVCSTDWACAFRQRICQSQSERALTGRDSRWEGGKSEAKRVGQIVGSYVPQLLMLPLPPTEKSLACFTLVLLLQSVPCVPYPHPVQHTGGATDCCPSFIKC